MTVSTLDANHCPGICVRCAVSGPAIACHHSWQCDVRLRVRFEFLTWYRVRQRDAARHRRLWLATTHRFVDYAPKHMLLCSASNHEHV
eukprot:912848-Rhodomonas_salina.1